MLIEELKKGSQEGFRTLVERYSHDVVRTCFNFVHNAEDAEDLAQEVFIQICQSIRQFRKESDIGTWIYRIAVNKSLDLVRKRRRKRRIADLVGLFRAKGRASHTPHEQLEEHERRRILREQIALLAQNQKIALVLSQFEGLSNGQIARIMQISESAVESLLHRARANLRKKLVEYFEKNL